MRKNKIIQGVAILFVAFVVLEGHAQPLNQEVFKKGVKGNVKQITEKNVCNGIESFNQYKFNEKGYLIEMKLQSFGLINDIFIRFKRS